MKDGMCKNHHSKDFSKYTTFTEDGYSQYGTTMDGQSITLRHHSLDNRWVVPYKPYLIALIDCDLNVKIYSTIKLIKYLYKYVYEDHEVLVFISISKMPIKILMKLQIFNMNNSLLLQRLFGIFISFSK